MTLNKSSSLPAILALGTTAPKLAGGSYDGRKIDQNCEESSSLGGIAKALVTF